MGTYRVLAHHGEDALFSHGVPNARSRRDDGLHVVLDDRVVQASLDVFPLADRHDLSEGPVPLERHLDLAAL